MTIAAWLRERSEGVPPRLTARIEEALGDRLHAPRAEVTLRCVEAAEQLLRELLARDSSGRDSALELLTVDALVTYGFEAASEQTHDLGARAVDAAQRFAAAANR